MSLLLPCTLFSQTFRSFIVLKQDDYPEDGYPEADYPGDDDDDDDDDDDSSSDEDDHEVEYDTKDGRACRNKHGNPGHKGEE